MIATHLPILDRGLFFARSHPERSYVLLAKLRSGGALEGMYLGDGARRTPCARCRLPTASC